MSKHKLLIIDDSREFTEDLVLMLGDKYEILTADTAEKGLRIVKNTLVSVLLLDLQLPDIHGLNVLEKIHNDVDPYLPVIVVTEYDDMEHVVKAMKLGAHDFLSKDFNLDILNEKIEQALNQKKLRVRISGLMGNNILTDDSFVLASEVMKKISYEISRLANLNVDVLLCGETGVGKDMVAAQIFLRSKRKDKPFIPVPIRTLSETLLESELFGHEKGSFTGADRMKPGKFESANQGFVYIPEISNLQESIQLKLLHFMQYKSITRVGHDMRKGEIKLDVRVIMATNENLEELVNVGRIREDFYYRISGVRLNIPPLRERREDIIPLANYFLEKYSSEFGRQGLSLSDQVRNAFLEYEWKGNVRELSNAVKNALIYSANSELTLKDFPDIISRTPYGELNDAENKNDFLIDYREYDFNTKKYYFESLMKYCGGKVSEASKIAGITPQGFRKILKQLGINY
ncbi:MAG: sigma-54-dependent transcriptional regulator [Ignavibacteria bacterium]